MATQAVNPKENRPPHDDAVNDFDEQEIPCPYCESHETEMIALFGPKLLTSQYYCRACHSAFEVVRADEPEE